MPLPLLTAAGDLPEGVHTSTQQEVIERFGTATARRRIVGMRLQRVLDLAAESGLLARAIIFGSFLTDKAEPNDVDLFLVMDDPFDLTQVSGEARHVFDHAAAQAHFGLGRAQLASKKLDEAIASLERTLVLDSTQPAHYRLGIAYQEKGNKAKAIEAFTKFLTYQSKGKTPDDANERLKVLKG